MNAPHPLMRMSRSRRFVVAGGLIAVTALIMTVGAGNVGPSPVEGVPVPAMELRAVIDAAQSCPSLSPPKLAGQLMEASRFTPASADTGQKQGIAGFTEAVWTRWAPWPGANRTDAQASIIALAHYMCDLMGKVRVGGLTGDQWRLGLAAHQSGFDAVRTAGDVPRDAIGYVELVSGFAAWYERHQDFGGPGLLDEPTNQPPVPLGTEQTTESTPPPLPTPTTNPAPSQSRSPQPSREVRAQPSPAPRPTQTVKRLVSAATGKCLTAPRSLAGTTLEIWPCDGRQSQEWTVMHDGTMRVAGLCMDTAGGSSTNLTKVQIATCSGNPSQQFRVNMTDDLFAELSRKCVDVYDGQTADGTNVVLWPCTGTPGQTWYLR